MQTEYKKSSSVIVFNGKGEIALQLRAARDDLFPSHWDFSASEGIGEGEDEKLTAEREIHEELGVEASVEFITRKRYTYPGWQPGTTREADIWIYKARHDGPFMPDTKEVEKVQFFTLEEIDKMMQAGTKFHPEFIFVWNEGVIANALHKV